VSLSTVRDATVWARKSPRLLNTTRPFNGEKEYNVTVKGHGRKKLDSSMVLIKDTLTKGFSKGRDGHYKWIELRRNPKYIMGEVSPESPENR